MKGVGHYLGQLLMTSNVRRVSLWGIPALSIGMVILPVGDGRNPGKFGCHLHSTARTRLPSTALKIQQCASPHNTEPSIAATFVFAQPTLSLLCHMKEN